MKDTHIHACFGRRAAGYIGSGLSDGRAGCEEVERLIGKDRAVYAQTLRREVSLLECHSSWRLIWAALTPGPISLSTTVLEPTVCSKTRVGQCPVSPILSTAKGKEEDSEGIG